MLLYAGLCVALFLCWEIYALTKRWGLAITTAILMAGKLSDPLRAKWVEETIARRNRYESTDQEREAQQEGDQLARLDPTCANGRAELWELAWENYRDAGRIKKGDYFRHANLSPAARESVR